MRCSSSTTPEVEWDMTHSLVADMGVYHGHDGVREFFREWRAFFAEYHAEPEQFIDADESVVVRVGHRGRGRTSLVGVDVPAFEMPTYWQVYRLRDGRAVRVEIHRDEAEALKAVGLRSHAPPDEDWGPTRAAASVGSIRP